jgi:hypothetical protein
MKYLQKKGESLSTFAKAARTSRMQLYRIMAGEGTTTSRLKQISEATGGELSVADLVSHEPPSNGTDEQERSQESAA